ncbi:MAG: hypothetical protein ACKO7W_17645 [Elainella sp.]
MRQSQAEIKAIEAELRSIRADSKVTLLDPYHRTQQFPEGSADSPIAPTIDRQALMASGQGKPQSNVAQINSNKPSISSSNRSVECFPLPGQSRGDYNQEPSYGTNQSGVRRTQLQTQSRTQSQTQPRTQPQTRSQTQSQIQSQTGASRRLAFPAEQFAAEQFAAEQLHDAQTQQHNARLLLAEKANQINALSNQQEAMLLELMSLSETLTEQLDLEFEPICEYWKAKVPYFETARTGTLKLKSRAVDLSDLDTATDNYLETHPDTYPDTYRPHRSRRQRGLVGLLSATALSAWQTSWGLLKSVGLLAGLITAPVTGLAKLLLGWSAAPTNRRPVRRPVETPFTLREAAVLVIGSALLRLGLDWLVLLYPALWIPSILIMLAPAAIAVYRSTLSPQTGFAWGYRLFSIMIGLLLGGRL